MLEKLPAKWCLRLASREINNAVNLIDLWKFGRLFWENQPSYTSRYITHNGLYISREQLPNFMEITFDDFKRLVLKEKSPQELLLEEAKLRYPIGTKFVPTMRGSSGSFEVMEREPFLTGSGDFIQDGPGGYSIYRTSDKKWAEIIKEEPMCAEKTIKLSLDQAKKMYGKSPEMDELLLANFSKEELTKKELPKSWSHLKNIQGYRIDESGDAVCADADCSPTCRRGRFFAEKQAKSALAMAQLSQLMAVYNDGWIADYSNANQIKIQIICAGNKIATNWSCTQNEFLSFKSAEIRDEFLKNFEPLIKEYFMID